MATDILSANPDTTSQGRGNPRDPDFSPDNQTPDAEERRVAYRTVGRNLLMLPNEGGWVRAPYFEIPTPGSLKDVKQEAAQLRPTDTGTFDAGAASQDIALPSGYTLVAGPEAAAPAKAAMAPAIPRRWFTQNAIPAKAESITLPVSYLTANPKGQGTYAMAGPDKKIVQIPYGRVMDASRAGYLIKPDDRERYARDRRAEILKSNPNISDPDYLKAMQLPAASPEQPGWWQRTEQAVMKATEPTTQYADVRGLSEITKDPVVDEVMTNFAKRATRFGFGAVDLAPQVYGILRDMNSNDPAKSADAESRLMALHPGAQMADRIKEFRDEWAKDPKLALTNLGADISMLLLSEKVAGAVKEAIPARTPRIRTAGEVLPPEGTPQELPGATSGQPTTIEGERAQAPALAAPEAAPAVQPPAPAALPAPSAEALPAAAAPEAPPAGQAPVVAEQPPTSEVTAEPEILPPEAAAPPAAEPEAPPQAPMPVADRRDPAAVARYLRELSGLHERTGNTEQAALANEEAAAHEKLVGDLEKLTGAGIQVRRWGIQPVPARPGMPNFYTAVSAKLPDGSVVTVNPDDLFGQRPELFAPPAAEAPPEAAPPAAVTPEATPEAATPAPPTEIAPSEPAAPPAAAEPAPVPAAPVAAAGGPTAITWKRIAGATPSAWQVPGTDYRIQLAGPGGGGFNIFAGDQLIGQARSMDDAEIAIQKHMGAAPAAAAAQPAAVPPEVTPAPAPSPAPVEAAAVTPAAVTPEVTPAAVAPEATPAPVRAPRKKPLTPRETKTAVQKVLSDFFTPGNVIYSGYWDGYDKVLDFRPTTPGRPWQVQVIRSDRAGNPLPGEQPRWHSTAPDLRPNGRGDRIVARAAPPAPIEPVETPKPAVSDEESKASHALARARTMDQNAALATATKSTHRDMPIIALNDDAMVLFDRLAGRRAYFSNGIMMGAESADKALIKLRKLAQKLPHATGLARLVEAMEQHKTPDGNIILHRTNMPEAKVNNVILEEVFHNWQHRHDLNTYKNINEISNAMRAGPSARAWLQAGKALREHGYGRAIPLEIPAWVAAGSDFGLGSERSTQLLVDYMKAVEQIAGRKAIDTMPPIAESIEKGVRDGFRASRERGVGRGAAGRPAPDLSGWRAEGGHSLQSAERALSEGRVAGRGPAGERLDTLESKREGPSGRAEEGRDPRAIQREDFSAAAAGRAHAYLQGAVPEGSPWTYIRRVRRDGGSFRVLGVPVHETWTLSPEKAAELAAAPKPAKSPDIHELNYADPKAAEVFRDAIAKTKEGNRFAASVHVYSPEEYAQTRMFLSADGKAGFALKPDGDIISVFTHGDGPKGAVHTMLEIAKQAGGTKLDAFDTVLPAIYGDHGFRAVARLPWNDEYSPEGWDKKTFGRFNRGEPDVVFMALDPLAGKYKAGDGVVADDYDHAVQLQAEAQQKLNAGTDERRPAQTFISPNIFDLKTTAEAQRRLTSMPQKWMQSEGSWLLDQLGVKAKLRGATGAWEGGSENSVVTEFHPDTDPDAVRYYSAIMAQAGLQKYLFNFFPDEEGPDDAFEFNVPKTSRQQIADTLAKHGIKESTIEDTPDGHSVIIAIKPEQPAKNAFLAFTELGGADGRTYHGRSEFLGDDDRGRAGQVFARIIEGQEDRHPVWRDIRSEIESRPDFRELRRAVRETPEPFTGVTHGSRTPGIVEVKTSYHGQGPQPGEESKRKRDWPQYWVDRSYFQIEGTPGEPPYRDFPHQYTATFNRENLYNFYADPRGLRAEVPESIKRQGSGAETTYYEKLIKDAGYDGYYADAAHYQGMYDPKHGMVIAFHDTPVEGRLKAGEIKLPEGGGGPAAPPGRVDTLPSRQRKPQPLETLQQAAERRRPRGSTVPLATAALLPRYKVIEDIAAHLEDHTRQTLDQMHPGGTPAEHRAMVNRAVRVARDELKYQLAQENSGADWYKDDIRGDTGSLMSEMKKLHPELSDPTNERLFLLHVAATSPGKTAAFDNVNVAEQAYSLFKKTGIIPERQEDGTPWGPYGSAPLRSAKGLMKFFKNDKAKAMEWMTTKHPLKEVENVKAKSGYSRDTVKNALPPDYDPDAVYGAYILGEKVGPFFLNLNGISTELTVDRWFMRTWNRLMGTLINTEGKLQDIPRGKHERAAMVEAIDKLGKEFGLETSQVQAALWYYEQGLYSRMGQRGTFGGTYANAAKDVYDLRSRGHASRGAENAQERDDALRRGAGGGAGAHSGRVRPEDTEGEGAGSTGELFGDISFEPGQFAGPEVIPLQEARAIAERQRPRRVKR